MKKTDKIRYSFSFKTLTVVVVLSLLLCNYSQLLVYAAEEFSTPNNTFSYPSPSDYTGEENSVDAKSSDETASNETDPDKTESDVQKAESDTPVEDSDIPGDVQDEQDNQDEEIILNEPVIIPSYDMFEKTYGKPVSVSQHEKTYRMTSESYLTVLSITPNTYLDARGREHKIDNTLVRKTSFFTGAYYQNKANSYVVRLPEEMDYDNGAEYIASGVDIELIPLEGSYTHPVALENAILYNQVFEDVDVQYSIYETCVKEHIILNKQTDKSSFTYELVANNADAEVVDNVIVITKRGSDEPQMYITAPEMFDAAGQSSNNITMSIERVMGHNYVTLTVDNEWLAAPERAYPVKIDPTVGINADSIEVFTMTERHNAYSAQEYGYGYVGTVTAASTSVAGTNMGEARLYFYPKFDFSQIPSEAKIDSAVLRVYQYTCPGNSRNAQFMCSMLKEKRATTSMKWNEFVNIPTEPAGENSISSSQINKYHEFDIKSAVNAWTFGLSENYGLVIKQTDPTLTAAAFFTSTSSNQNPGQAGFNSDIAPYIALVWSVPDPVDVNLTVNDTTVLVRPIVETSLSGNLNVLGVSFDGLAKPASIVDYSLNNQDHPYTGSVNASFSYKYPDTSPFESAFPAKATRYRDKLSNWQSTVPLVEFENDTVYYLNAKATYDTVGNTVASDKFLIYKIKQFDTLPKIASYYGVPLNQIVYDNRVQDMLLVEGNTLFIRNPVTEEPYNPADLSVDDKIKVDSLLMGRGLHCEYGYEPINLNTGNFVVEREDYSVPDFGGNFTLSRTYNSKGAKYNSIFGRGWSFEYDQSLSLRQNGDIIYARGDGGVIPFTKEGDSYTCAAGYHMNLRKVANGSKTVDLGEGDETYTVYEYEITDSEKSVYRFNCYGSLLWVRNAKGQVTSFEYDENQFVSRITSPAGYSFGIVGDGRGHIAGISLPGGKSISYTYDDKGNLTEVTDAMGFTVKYFYDDAHQMTSWSDENGHTVAANTYDEFGRVISQRDGNGKVTTLAYVDGQTTVTDGDGYTTVYYYDDNYRTTKILYADGSSVENGYDENNHLAWTKDELGHTTTYQYDANGNCTKVTRYDGATASYTYNGLNLVTKEVGFDGHMQSFTYNDAGDLISATNAAGLTVRCEYDGNHRMTVYTDAKGNVTTFSYDRALVTSARNSDGGTVSYSYNSDGLVTSVVQPDGGVYRYMYDNNRRKTGEQLPEGEYTRYVYDQAGNVISIIDPNGNTSSFSYDAVGNMLRGTDPLGGTLTYSYDARGNVTSERDADGHTTSYSYDAKSRKTSETNADGYTTHYGYDRIGNLVSVTNGNGSRTSYGYDYRFNAPSSQTDALGNVTKYTYNASGNVTKIEYANGSSASYAYDALGRLTSENKPNGLKVSYTYDNNGNLLSAADNAGRTLSYVYNSLNLPVKTTDANGNEITYTYDACNRAVAITNSMSGVLRMAYDRSGRKTSVTDENGNTSKFAYDNNGNVVTQTDPNGHSSTITYNKVDNIGIVTDANGNQTMMTYTGAENLSKVSDALGGSLKYAYNGRGLPVKITDSMGNSSSMTYDGNGNVTSYVLADGNTTTCTYDALDRLTKTEEASGKVTEFTYDCMGNVTTETDNAGNEFRYTYDSVGNLLTATNTLGQTVEYQYDLCGNAVSEKLYDGTTSTYSYDRNGNLVSSVDAENRLTNYTYDRLDRLVKTTDASGREWKYTYDAAGRLTQFTDPSGATESYAYDKADNLIKVTDADGNSVTYTYDAAGNLVSQKDKNGNETKLGYDALNRVISRTNADESVEEYLYNANSQLVKAKDALGNVTEYSYDRVGNLTSLKAPNGATYTYAYDAAYNVVTETDPIGGTTSMSYDLNGNLTEKVLANAGKYSYTYDKLSRLTKVSAPGGQTMSFTYDSHNDIVSQKDNGGRVTKYTYDVMHRVTQVVNPAGNVTSYTYDANGNLTNVVTPSGASTSYAYDVLDRITSVTDAKGEVSKIAYDKLGNVSKITNEKGKHTTYSYDANGNLISVTNALGEVSKNSYDSMNRIVKETDPAGKSTSYSYDEAGHLVGVTAANNGQVKMSYDSNGNLSSITDAVNRPITYQYDLNDRLVKVKQGGAETRYAYDAVGNVTAVTNGEGNTTSYEYDAASRLTSARNPLDEITSYVYDRNGNLSKVKQADGSTISYDYDALDSLVSKNYSEESTPSVLYGYDSEGRCVSMDDFSGKNAYQYDELGRVVSVTSSNGEKIGYRYDKCGNLSKLIYPDGSSVSYEYDALNRLTSVIDRDGQTTSYTYDRSGNVTEVKRPNDTRSVISYNSINAVTKVTNYAANDRAISEYEYEYDLSGAITKEISIVEGKKAVREFEYDAVGSLHSETVSAGKSTCKYTYEYDHSGNRTKVTSDENGKESTVTYQYDKADRLTRTTDSVNGNTLFTYDANGNRASKTGSDGVKYTYEYDTENRLRAVKDNGTLLMAALYDGNGDRVFTVNRSTRNYTETTSQPGVNSPTGATHGSDSSDNTANAGLNGQPQGTMYLYAYDDKLPEDPANSIFWYGFGQGMINSITVASAHLSVWFNEMWETITDHFELFARRLGDLGILGSEEKEYSYDYKGGKPSQQLQDQMYLYQTMLIPYGFSDKTEEDYELMLYVNDVNRGYTETLATYGTDGYVNTVYTYGNERLISEQFGKSSYYTYNGRGDVSSLLSDVGAPQVSYSYDAYGNYAATAANDNPYKFNAEAFDYSTGLQYLRARYYDNSIGGFISQDSYRGSLNRPSTLNLYDYVSNDPINKTDPSGHGERLNRLGRTILNYGKSKIDNKITEFNNAVNDFKSKVDNVKTKFNNAVNGFKSKVDNVKTEFNNAVNGFKSKVDSVKTKFNSAANGLKNGFDYVTNAINDPISVIGDGISGLLSLNSAIKNNSIKIKNDINVALALSRLSFCTIAPYIKTNTNPLNPINLLSLADSSKSESNISSKDKRFSFGMGFTASLIINHVSTPATLVDFAPKSHTHLLSSIDLIETNAKNQYAKSETSYYAGRMTGDAIGAVVDMVGIVGGVITSLSGKVLEGTSIFTTSTGVGAGAGVLEFAAGVSLDAAGVAATIYFSGSLASSSNNLYNNFNKFKESSQKSSKRYLSNQEANKIKNEKTYVVRGKEVTEKEFKSLRTKAVNQAWDDEVELVKRTGKGTRDWTDAEMHELLTTGKVKGYEGQHMKSAEAFPDYVDVPENIQFLKGRFMNENEHLAAHGGNYRNPTNGYYDPKTKTFIDFGDIVPWEGR